jgi:hypothetical protein
MERENNNYYPGSGSFSYQLNGFNVDRLCCRLHLLSAFLQMVSNLTCAPEEGWAKHHTDLL